MKAGGSDIVSSSGYLCLAGAGEDASGCVNAGDDEASRSTSEDAPCSLLHRFHLFLLRYPLLHHLRFLSVLVPSLFLAPCPQRPAEPLYLSPSHALFLRFCLAHTRRENELEPGRSRRRRLGRGQVVDEKTESWEEKNGALGDEVRWRWRLVEQAEEELAGVE